MLTVIAVVVALLFVRSSWGVVLVAGAAAVDLAETGALVWWSRRRRRRAPAVVGLEAIVGRTGVVLGRLGPSGAAAGQVRVGGETWRATSTRPVDPGVEVTVRAVEGLVLRVEPVPDD